MKTSATRARFAGFVVLCFLACAPAAFSQVVSDPVYAYIDRWQARGYIGPSYTLRPYSPEVVIGLLEQVVEKGSPDDARAASEFLARYTGAGASASLVQRSTVRLGGDGPVYDGEYGLRLELLSGVLPETWVMARCELLALDGSTSLVLAGERSEVDLNQDGSLNDFLVGLSGEPLSALFALSAVSTFAGGEDLWASAGYSRSSAGPFFDNGVVVGPQAHAAPNWTLHATLGDLRFSSALFQLTPTTNDDDSLDYNDQAGKYLVYHSLSYAPVDSVDIGVFETVVWGGDFKPLYLMPVSVLFLLQSLNGFGDNSLIGLYGTWRPLDGLMAKATVYVDDLSLNALSSLDFDTKIIGAAQAGLSWAPESGPATLVSFDYTAVFPYMYAHRYTTYEDNYTHCGDSFGAALEPNSDRFELRATLAPVSGITVTGLARFLRHGNASAGITSGDGTWFDDGWDGGVPTYQEPYVTGTSPEYFRFLSQDVLETRLQTGFTVSWGKDFGWSSLRIGARYVFEAVWNEDLSAGDDKLYHYIGIDTIWTF